MSNILFLVVIMSTNNGKGSTPCQNKAPPNPSRRLFGYNKNGLYVAPPLSTSRFPTSLALAQSELPLAASSPSSSLGQFCTATISPLPAPRPVARATPSSFGPSMINLDSDDGGGGEEGGAVVGVVSAVL